MNTFAIRVQIKTFKQSDIVTTHRYRQSPLSRFALAHLEAHLEAPGLLDIISSSYKPTQNLLRGRINPGLIINILRYFHPLPFVFGIVTTHVPFTNDCIMAFV